VYSASSTSWISGGVIAVATAAAGIMQLSASSTPDPLPVSFIVVTSLVVALVVGIAMAIAVRVGLRIASCGQLVARYAFLIPGVSLLIVGIFATWPVETHAIKLDVASGRASPLSPPLTFWLFIVAAISVPVFVSYVIGRLARAKQGPLPNRAFERTREG
jgi:hypothetical protein